MNIHTYAGKKILGRDIRVEHPLKLGLDLVCSKNGKEASNGEAENEPRNEIGKVMGGHLWAIMRPLAFTQNEMRHHCRILSREVTRSDLTF